MSISGLYLLKFLLSVWLISASIFGWITREHSKYDLDDYLVGVLVLSVGTTAIAGLLWAVVWFLFFYWGEV